jgi:methylated-DNA-[protein]-cysteine S-methyltransferase
VTFPNRTYTVVDSPIGPMTLVAENESLRGINMDDPRHLPPNVRFGHPDPGDSAVLAAARRQLEEYFAGERTDFDLPLAAEGTPFQRRVWDALREIPYGETVSYGELARRIGQPTASRAVGLANGKNPISIVVPCHRVLGSTGKLIGYGGGLDRKQTLLELERARDRLL